ncbi:hypothetical protein [Paenibacillus sp. IITD108]|uniref:hypothetical protein n=1 Tax=Paenibacillus sp. IITD108 TaxID=3116649 RepID=UPI002F3E3096
MRATIGKQKERGTKSKIGNGEAVASAFVDQFYPMQGGVISSKKLDYNSGRNPKLDRSNIPFDCLLPYPQLIDILLSHAIKTV